LIQKETRKWFLSSSLVENGVFWFCITGRLL